MSRTVRSLVPPAGRRRRRPWSGSSPSPPPAGRLRRPGRRERHHPADPHQHPRRLPRRRRALRDVLRVHRRGRGGRVDHPAARTCRPRSCGGRLDLQRLAQEVAPPSRSAAFGPPTALGRAARRGDPRDADRRPRHHGAGGRRRRGRRVGRATTASCSRPTRPRSSTSTASRSQIFMAARFDASRAAELGQTAGDGTPIMLTIPTDAALGAAADPEPRPRGRAARGGRRLPPHRRGARAAGRRPGLRLERSEPADDLLLDDLRSDVGMEWVPERDVVHLPRRSTPRPATSTTTWPSPPTAARCPPSPTPGSSAPEARPVRPAGPGLLTGRSSSGWALGCWRWSCCSDGGGERPDGAGMRAPGAVMVSVAVALVVAATGTRSTRPPASVRSSDLGW